MKVFIIIGCHLFSSLALATFVPEDQIKIELNSLNPSEANITEKQFRSIITTIESIYAPIASQHSGNLKINGDWNSEKLNAAANQIFGSWMVQITGGLARHPDLSPDGFALILCHELGHHLGGFSFAKNGPPFVTPWAANEGQSDYFATHVCARRIWENETAVNETFATNIEPYAQQQCDLVWQTADDRNLCYRIVTASHSVAKTMANLMQKPVPSVETPDISTVEKTSDAHPQPQCRLDTSVQGALCTAIFNENIIPGKSVNGGPHSENAEKEAAMLSCTALSGFTVGQRPPCWYKARM